jgi:hypothetical protein
MSFMGSSIRNQPQIQPGAAYAATLSSSLSALLYQPFA